MAAVALMGDLFHRRVLDVEIKKTLDVLSGNRYVDFQLLTKRPKRALDVINAWGTLPENVWFGMTCENQRRLDERLPILRKVNAAVKWLSIEPMLEAITIPSFDGISWVVVGGESGDNRRLFDVAWARAIRDQCRAAGVPFFYKQGSGRRPGSDPYLDGELVQEWPITSAAAIGRQLALF
jgi:protein gp37